MLNSYRQPGEIHDSITKLKVYRANSNSQTTSLYPIRFSINILFTSLVSFAFCLCVNTFFLKQNIYILIHIQLWEWVSDKKLVYKVVYKVIKLVYKVPGIR